MTRLSKGQQVLLCLLCGILALVCAFCLLLPHHHQCEGVQCQICALLGAYEMLWLPTTTGIVVVCVVRLLIKPDREIDTFGAISLVRLKVKLSD